MFKLKCTSNKETVNSTLVYTDMITHIVLSSVWEQDKVKVKFVLFNDATGTH